MQGDTLERFRGGFTRSYGATFVTGPTGSGKTTSLYSALNVINQPEMNIITIEDPVEYQIPGLTQVQVNLKAGLTFASGLRSIVRSDPDVIMVGEIRDKETAQIAIESALTGHLVLSTLHTNDAPTAITPPHRDGDRAVPHRFRARLRDLAAARAAALHPLQGARRAAAGALQPVRHPHRPRGLQGRRLQALRLQRLQGPDRHLRGDAHDARRSARSTIEKASADQIRQVAIEQGMRTLQQDGIDKVRMGITSIQEIARITGSALPAD